VLVHGITATHRYFRDNVEPLSRRWRVIAVDLPGFGRSQKPDASYSIDWFVDELSAFLDGKELERVHLAGNSMGGHIAMRFALRHPRRVDRLVLVAPSGVGLMPLKPLHLLLGGIEFPFRKSGVVPRVPIPVPAIGLLFHRLVFPNRPDLAERYTRAYARAVASPELPLHLRAAFRAMREILKSPLRDRAREIAAPTLIVWGARDGLLPVTAARGLRKRIPHARLLIYKHSGHCPMVDQAERWNRDVARFLDGELVGR
jgi:pimeloyl-ACP methyl ester carboxylesterase